MTTFNLYLVEITSNVGNRSQVLVNAPDAFTAAYMAQIRNHSSQGRYAISKVIFYPDTPGRVHYNTAMSGDIDHLPTGEGWEVTHA